MLSWQSMTVGCPKYSEFDKYEGNLKFLNTKYIVLSDQANRRLRGGKISSPDNIPMGFFSHWIKYMRLLMPGVVCCFRGPSYNNNTCPAQPDASTTWEQPKFALPPLRLDPTLKGIRMHHYRKCGDLLQSLFCRQRHLLFPFGQLSVCISYSRCRKRRSMDVVCTEYGSRRTE